MEAQLNKPTSCRRGNTRALPSYNQWVLTVFTLQAASSSEQTTLHLRRRSADLKPNTSCRRPVTSPEAWVPVRRVFHRLSMRMWSLGDVTGDGLLDLITCNSIERSCLGKMKRDYL